MIFHYQSCIFAGAHCRFILIFSHHFLKSFCIRHHVLLPLKCQCTCTVDWHPILWKVEGGEKCNGNQSKAFSIYHPPQTKTCHSSQPVDDFCTLFMTKWFPDTIQFNSGGGGGAVAAFILVTFFPPVDFHHFHYFHPLHQCILNYRSPPGGPVDFNWLPVPPPLPIYSYWATPPSSDKKNQMLIIFKLKKY